MSFEHWLVFVLVICALIGSPGPSSLLCITHGARYGAKRAMGTVFGGVSAALCLMLLSAAGIGAILAASTTVFTVLKFVGAAYLVYLGVKAWSHAPIDFSAAYQDGCALQPKSARTLFINGFGVGIANPKDLLFFGALFPQFINSQAPIVPQVLILACTWFVVEILIMGAYAWVGRHIAAFFTSARRVRWFNRITGSAFIAAGGLLAASSK